ncbi:unnamed protein product [Ilex paraguariensis]|uniref:Uncharacterized protein n=1 Tax=Ilex paraguariensis TaxID=185542 RepID=A0ABC8UQV7_9AQUA
MKEGGQTVGILQLSPISAFFPAQSLEWILAAPNAGLEEDAYQEKKTVYRDYVAKLLFYQINSLTLVDPLGCNNTVTMPLVSPLNRNTPTVQIASVLPSAVSSSTNNQCSSSGLGMHIPADSSNVRNAQGVNLHSHSILIPPSNSSSQDPSIDRILPKTQIPIPGRDSQVPLVISNAQNPSTIQVPSSPILFGSLNAVIENGLSYVVMVSINDAANPNNTTVAFDLGNAREIGMEDMENGRNMLVLG